LDRQRPLNGVHPTEQLLDVFAGLGVIFAQVVAGGHPLTESVFDGMFKAIGRIGRIEEFAGIRKPSRSEHTAVPSEKVLKAQVRLKMTGGGRYAAVVIGTVANQLERLGLPIPLMRIYVVVPYVSGCGSDLGGVGFVLLCGLSGKFGGHGIRRS